MLDADFDPAKLANPASGFRFPGKMSFSNDQGSVELRLVISGWLKLADQIVSNNAGIQELRDASARINELIVALSARQLALQKEQQAQAQARVKSGKTQSELNGHKTKRRKAAEKAGPTKVEAN